MTGLSIATDRSLIEIDERYRAVFSRQHERLVPLLRDLTDAQWRSPSRNAAWTVHQTMQHVAGVRIENVRVFEGGERTWSADFDPHRSPQEDIDTRADESPEETVDGHVDATERFVAHLGTRSASEARTRMLWGERADFRLFFLHIHWDSWVHERDMLLPLGLPHECDVESLRFATAYAVLFAGVAIQMSGSELETVLTVPRLGDVHLRATQESLRVDVGEAVTPGRSASGFPVVDASLLVDALSGRGDVGAVVDAPDDVVAALSMIGAFIRG